MKQLNMKKLHYPKVIQVVIGSVKKVKKTIYGWQFYLDCTNDNCARIFTIGALLTNAENIC